MTSLRYISQDYQYLQDALADGDQHATTRLINSMSRRNDLVDALRALVEWNAVMGSFDAPCWKRARYVLDQVWKDSGGTVRQEGGAAC
jgi:hypothetical protein